MSDKFPGCVRHDLCRYPACDCDVVAPSPPGRFPVCEALRAGSCRYPACHCGGHSNLLPPRPDRLHRNLLHPSARAVEPGQFFRDALPYILGAGAIAAGAAGVWPLIKGWFL